MTQTAQQVRRAQDDIPRPLVASDCGLTGVTPPVGGVGYKGSSPPGRHTAPAKAFVPLPFSSDAPRRVRAAGSGGARRAEPGELSQAAPPGGRGHDSGSRRLPFRVPPKGQTEVAGVYLPQEPGASVEAHAPLQQDGEAPGGGLAGPAPDCARHGWWEETEGASSGSSHWAGLGATGPFRSPSRSRRREPAAAGAFSGPMVAHSQPACSRDRDKNETTEEVTSEQEEEEDTAENGMISAHCNFRLLGSSDSPV
ncbi:PREDICTED: collagen alpha-1(II) chain-like, partial [Cercocebus atys]|uniref:collagen alpha-1(II) chain-like n=1 Tax=Cercocebus atys TaxID=9531 RepID=UPI0005F57F8D